MRLTLGLSPASLIERRKGIGGSDAKILMEGDPAALLALWEEKTGRREGEDLSRVLPVQLGSFTEPFNLHWYEVMTGRTVTNEGEVHIHGDRGFMRCTLDGLTTTAAGKPAVFQAKHVNAFSKIEEVTQRYMPQVHHEMHVAGMGHAILSVLMGTMAYEVIEIPCDEFYLAQLIDRERAFWDCVVNDTPPCVLEPIAAPVMPTEFRTVDMQGNNEWADAAADWLAGIEAVKKCAAAEIRIKGDKKKKLKGLLESDVGLATGHGIQAKRAKNGAVTITAIEAVKAAA